MKLLMAYLILASLEERLLISFFFTLCILEIWMVNFAGASIFCSGRWWVREVSDVHCLSWADKYNSSIHEKHLCCRSSLGPAYIEEAWEIGRKQIKVYWEVYGLKAYFWIMIQQNLVIPNGVTHNLMYLIAVAVQVHQKILNLWRTSKKTRQRKISMLNNLRWTPKSRQLENATLQEKARNDMFSW